MMVAPPVRLELTAAVDRAAQVSALLRPFPPVMWNQQSHMPEQSASQQQTLQSGLQDLQIRKQSSLCRQRKTDVCMHGHIAGL